MNKRIWTTKDGIKIPINKMSDIHLLNTLKYLEKRGKQVFEENLRAAYAVSGTFSDDSMASYYCDQDISSMEEQGFDPYDIPFYEELHKEALKRDLL